MTGKERKTDLTRRKILVDFDGVFLLEGCWRECCERMGELSGATTLLASGGGGGARWGVRGLCLGVGISCEGL